jgi:ABC-2 type transport system permease protein
MDTSLLRYRPWRGEFHSAGRSIWPIARVGLQMVLRRKLFWVLYALALVIFFLFFFGQYLLSWIETQASEQSVPVLGFRAAPAQLIRLLRDGAKLNGSGDTYRNFFWYQGYMVMILLTLAGSILVGNDFRHGSLPFYLSKPLDRWHYVLGKCLATAVFVNLATTIPALVLFIQFGFLDSWEYFAGEGVFIGGRDYGLHLPINPLLFGILGYGLVLTVCLSLLLVATASWLRRTVPMIMVWATLFFFFRLLAGTLVDGLQYAPRWRLIDLWNDMYLLGNYCLGMSHESIRPTPQPAFHEAAFVLACLCLLCLGHLIFRIRAVEVVR